MTMTISSLNLTAAEVEAIRAIASGRSDKEAGLALGLTANTVRNQLASARRKLGLGNRTQLALFAVRAGIAAAEVSR